MKYLGTTLTNQNVTHEEMASRSRLNLGHTCYNSFQNLLSSCLSKSMIKIKQKYNFHVVQYGCENWSLTLGEEN
jgi:hypothetical protein